MTIVTEPPESQPRTTVVDHIESPVEMTVLMHPRTVYVHAGLTPLAGRTMNLLAVTDAFDRAGIDYFVVRGMDDRTSVIGVEAVHRDAVFEALREVAAQTTAYVSQISPVPATRAPMVTGDSPAVWRGFAKAQAVRFAIFRTEPSQQLILGHEYGCDIEFWVRDADRATLVSPRPNRTARMVPAGGVAATVPGEPFTRFAPLGRPTVPAVRSRADFVAHLPDEIDFPIDAVYTWVDHTDPRWEKRRADASHTAYHAEAASAARFISRDELRYSLRSLHLYAPWIRNIYIVTDDQLPYWLDTSRPGVSVISHRDLFEPGSRLPTFNSHAIESQLYRTPGLAEHFIYFNDDVFLGRPVTPDTFFHGNGVAKFFLSRSAPLDSGEPSFGDIPVDAAGKNNREVLRERFGRTVTQKMKHTPHAMRRSVLEKISTELREHVTRTRDNQFRHPTDLSIASSLHHYWSYLEGTSVPGSLRYLYTDLADPETATRLIRLLRQRDFHTFCLNDTDSDPATRVEMAALISLFLSQYFPVRSPFELTPEREADRRGIGATNLAEMMHGASAVAAAAAAIVDATTVTSSTALSFGRSADDRLAIGIGAGIQRVAPLDEQMQTTDSAMR